MFKNTVSLYIYFTVSNGNIGTGRTSHACPDVDDLVLCDNFDSGWSLRTRTHPLDTFCSTCHVHDVRVACPQERSARARPLTSAPSLLGNCCLMSGGAASACVLCARNIAVGVGIL